MRFSLEILIPLLLSMVICAENVQGLCRKESFLIRSREICYNRQRSSECHEYKAVCTNLEDAEKSSSGINGVYMFVALSTKSTVIKLPSTLQQTYILVVENTKFEQVSSLSSLNQLREIHFSHNNIHEIPWEMFSMMSNLQVLDLSYNRIEHIDLMAFSSNNQLKYLYINNNNISQISIDVFSNLMSLRTLDLSNNPITHFSLAPTQHTNVNNRYSQTYSTSTGLKSLNMSNINLDSTNYGLVLHKFGKIFEEINLSKNMITKINSIVFSEFQMLQTLNLSHNLIDSIDAASFHNNLNLKHVYLNNNNIRNLTSSWFNENANLKHVDLSHNPVGYIDDTFFLSVENLTMVNSNLNDANVEMLQRLKAQMVNVSHNNVTEIKLDSWHIVSLDASFNNIELFENYNPWVLEELVLRNNKIPDLKQITLHSLENCPLKVVDISDNPITNFSSSFLNDSQNLRELYLESLHIKEDSLKLNTNIKRTISKISLKANLLMAIDNELFSNCTSLTYLDLSSNFVSTIDRDAFLDLYNLQELYAQNNSLKSIPSVLFRSTTSLTHLDLSNNKLKFLPIGVFENCRNLMMLNLSSNHLQNLNEYNLYPLKNLQELYLQNNQLQNVDGIEYLENLQNLSLKNNPWKCKNLQNILTKLELGAIDNIEHDSSLPISHHIRHIACDYEEVDLSIYKTPTRHTNSENMTDFEARVNSLLEDIDENIRQLLNEIKMDLNSMLGNSSEIEYPSESKSLFENMNRNFEKIIEEMQKQQREKLQNHTNVIPSSHSPNPNSDVKNLTTEMSIFLRNIKENFDKVLSQMKDQQNSRDSDTNALGEYTNKLSSNLSNDINQINLTLTKLLQEIQKNSQHSSNANNLKLVSSHKESLDRSGDNFKPELYVNMVLGLGIFCVLCVSLYLQITKRKTPNNCEEHQLIETKM